MYTIEHKYKLGDKVWCLMNNIAREGDIVEIKISITEQKREIGYFVKSKGRMEYKKEEEIGVTKNELINIIGAL